MQIQNNLTFQKKSPSFSALIIENPRGTRYINSLNMDELKFLEECGKKLEKTKHVDVFIGSKDFSSSVGIKEKSGLNIYSVNKLIKTDEGYLDTVKKLKDMGYSYLQFSGRPFDVDLINKGIE